MRPLQILTTFVSTLVLTTTIVLAAPGLVGSAQANASAVPASSATTADRPVAAPKFRQCLPRPEEQSLEVRGKVTCKAVKKFIDQARELAAFTADTRYERFTIRGFLCTFPTDSATRFNCRDTNGKPKRYFRWADRT